MGELVQSSTYAVDTATELSDYFLKPQSARHEALEGQNSQKLIRRSTSVEVGIKESCSVCKLF